MRIGAGVRRLYTTGATVLQTHSPFSLREADSPSLAGYVPSSGWFTCWTSPVLARLELCGQ